MVGILTGNVVEASSLSPISCADVHVGPLSGSSVNSLTSVETKTDVDGFFGFELPPDLYQISVTASNYAFTYDTTAEISDDVTTFVQIDIPTCSDSIEAKASLQGRVLDAQQGLPVSDVAIIILEAAGPVQDILPITDLDGRFSLDDLPVGSLTLRVLNVRKTVTLRPGETTKVVLLVQLSDEENTSRPN